MTLMKAAVFTDIGKVEIKEIEKPRPGQGEVLVKIKACALCTFEQRVYGGQIQVPFPFIGGHEVAGVIEELGDDVDDKRWDIGLKVAIRLLENCGECHYCRIGEENLCEQGYKGETSLSIPGPGGLSEYIVVPSTKLYDVSDDLAFRIAALSEPLACVTHSIERGQIEIGSDVVVIGAGIMGMLHAILAKRLAARVIVCEVDEERRNLAKTLGADVVLNPVEEDLVTRVKELTGGRGADVVFNTTAISEVAEQATKLAAKTGRVVFYSSIHPDKPISLSPDYIHRSEVTITGSVSPSVQDFLKSTKLLSSGIINPELLISKEVTFDRVQEAFEMAVVPNTYRVVVGID